MRRSLGEHSNSSSSHHRLIDYSKQRAKLRQEEEAQLVLGESRSSSCRLSLTKKGVEVVKRLEEEGEEDNDDASVSLLSLVSNTTASTSSIAPANDTSSSNDSIQFSLRRSFSSSQDSSANGFPTTSTASRLSLSSRSLSLFLQGNDLQASSTGNLISSSSNSRPKGSMRKSMSMIQMEALSVLEGSCSSLKASGGLFQSSFSGLNCASAAKRKSCRKAISLEEGATKQTIKSRASYPTNSNSNKNAQWKSQPKAKVNKPVPTSITLIGDDSQASQISTTTSSCTPTSTRRSTPMTSLHSANLKPQPMASLPPNYNLQNKSSSTSATSPFSACFQKSTTTLRRVRSSGQVLQDTSRSSHGSSSSASTSTTTTSTTQLTYHRMVRCHGSSPQLHQLATGTTLQQNSKRSSLPQSMLRSIVHNKKNGPTMDDSAHTSTSFLRATTTTPSTSLKNMEQDNDSASSSNRSSRTNTSVRRRRETRTTRTTNSNKASSSSPKNSAKHQEELPPLCSIGSDSSLNRSDSSINSLLLQGALMTESTKRQAKKPSKTSSMDSTQTTSVVDESSTLPPTIRSKSSLPSTLQQKSKGILKNSTGYLGLRIPSAVQCGDGPTMDDSITSISSSFQDGSSSATSMLYRTNPSRSSSSNQPLGSLDFYLSKEPGRRSVPSLHSHSCDPTMDTSKSKDEESSAPLLESEKVQQGKVDAMSKVQQLKAAKQAKKEKKQEKKKRSSIRNKQQEDATSNGEFQELKAAKQNKKEKKEEKKKRSSITNKQQEESTGSSRQISGRNSGRRLLKKNASLPLSAIRSGEASMDDSNTSSMNSSLRRPSPRYRRSNTTGSSIPRRSQDGPPSGSSLHASTSRDLTLDSSQSTAMDDSSTIIPAPIYGRPTRNGSRRELSKSLHSGMKLLAKNNAEQKGDTSMDESNTSMSSQMLRGRNSSSHVLGRSDLYPGQSSFRQESVSSFRTNLSDPTSYQQSLSSLRTNNSDPTMDCSAASTIMDESTISMSSHRRSSIRRGDSCHVISGAMSKSEMFFRHAQQQRRPSIGQQSHSSSSFKQNRRSSLGQQSHSSSSFKQNRRSSIGQQSHSSSSSQQQPQRSSANAQWTSSRSKGGAANPNALTRLRNQLKGLEDSLPVLLPNHLQIGNASLLGGTFMEDESESSLGLFSSRRG